MMVEIYDEFVAELTKLADSLIIGLAAAVIVTFFVTHKSRKAAVKQI